MRRPQPQIDLPGVDSEMSDSLHTPRPWRFKLKNAGNGFLIIDANENQICDVYMTNLKSVAEERARLITAAPELLEACKAAYSMFAGGESIEEHRLLQRLPELLKSAIKKAEGGQK